VKGDGNCQFYALSDQLYGTQDKASSMRKAVVSWLRPRGDWNPTKSPGAELKNFATRSWEEYCDLMAKDGRSKERERESGYLCVYLSRTSDEERRMCSVTEIVSCCLWECIATVSRMHCHNVSYALCEGNSVCVCVAI
jgi:hypothetical protein